MTDEVYKSENTDQPKHSCHRCGEEFKNLRGLQLHVNRRKAPCVDKRAHSDNIADIDLETLSDDIGEGKVIIPEDLRNRLDTQIVNMAEDFRTLMKELFDGHSVRVLGTADEPLFVANDIANILDIKNIHDTLRTFEDYEKGCIDIPDAIGRIRETTILTEAGLFSLIARSRKPTAREFKKWVLTVLLPNIRKLSMITQPNAIIPAPLAIPLKDVLDINNFVDHSCIYIVHVTENVYKFGTSNGIDNRISAHMNTFSKLGYEPRVLNIWKCDNARVMMDTEYKIKQFGKQAGIMTDFHGQKEMLCTDDIEYICGRINEYVDEGNLKVTSTMTWRINEQINENQRLINEELRLRREISDDHQKLINEELKLRVRLQEMLVSTSRRCADVSYNSDVFNVITC